MDIFQTLMYIALVYQTELPCPNVHVHMISDKLMKVIVTTKNGTLTDIFNFREKLIWPGRVQVKLNGEVNIQFNKIKHENWETPYATKILANSPIPEVWRCQVLANEPLSHDATTLSIAHLNKIFTYIYPGRYFQIMRLVDGKTRVFTFMPLPMFPVRDLDYPNPRPGSFHSTGESIRLVTKVKPPASISGWLARRNLGSVVQLTNQIGNFCPADYINNEELIFISSGAGFRELIPLVMWSLQANDYVKVSMLIFGRTENDITWVHHIRKLRNVTEFRLSYHTILSHATKYWRGKRGRPNYIWLERLVPFGNVSGNRVVFLSGRPMFSSITKRQLIESHLYPENRVLIIDKHSLIGDHIQLQIEKGTDVMSDDQSLAYF